MISRLLIHSKKVKKHSEDQLKALGAEVLDWLPVTEKTNARPPKDVAARALILNALIQIYFQAPTDVVSNWIRQNRLDKFLTPSEIVLLTKTNDNISDQEKTNLFWLIEALWALMWVGSHVEELSPVVPVGETLAGMFPILKHNEEAEPFFETYNLKSYKDLYAMRDLYYRSHWYVRNGQLNNYDTGNFNIDVIMERRRALEWVLDTEQNWDSVEMST